MATNLIDYLDHRQIKALPSQHGLEAQKFVLHLNPSLRPLYGIQMNELELLETTVFVSCEWT